MTMQEAWATCEAAPEGETNTFLVVADCFAEHGRPDLEAVLRWMAKWDKRPRKHPGMHNGATNYMWTCYGGLCGAQFECGTRHTLPRALCRRIGFHEWYLRENFQEAVQSLADALAQGNVDCAGDPEKVDEL